MTAILKNKSWLLIISAALAFIFTLTLAAKTPILAQEDSDQDRQYSDDETVELNPVQVQDAKEMKGNAEVGYMMDTVESLGPWGDIRAQDTPYTMMTVSSEMMENTANDSIERLIKVLPGVYDTGGAGGGRHDSGVQRMYSRGFITNYTVDGFKSSDYSIASLYNYDRVEMISGFDSFFSGVSDEIGGTVNFVTKRPTDYFLNRITIGNYGGQQYYVTGDFGGPILGGKFGYRINFQYSDGETAIDGLRARYKGISGAFDWHITDTLLLQFDATFNSDRANGDTGGVGLSKNYYISPPNSHIAYGQDWTYRQTDTTTYGVNLKWNPFDFIALRASYKWHKFNPTHIRGAADDMNMYLNPDYDPAYRSFAIRAGNMGLRYLEGLNIYTDLIFDKSWMKHKIVLGYSIDWNKTYAAPAENQQFYLPDDLSYANYIPVGQIRIPRPTAEINELLRRTHKIFTKSGEGYTRDIVIGDKMDLGDHWTAFIGFNYTKVFWRRYKSIQVLNPTHPSGTETMPIYIDEIDSESNYQAKWTPTYSLQYKPTKSVTLYATYIQQLTQLLDEVPIEGWVSVPGAGWQIWPYSNARYQPAPTESYSYEGGVKWTFNDSFLVTVAYYYLNKVNSFDFNDFDARTITWLTDGRQIHQGIDMTFSGKLTDRLTLVGGWTWIDAKIRDAAPESKQHEGMTPSGVPKYIGKLYFEYQFPWVDGLFLTGGAYYTGEQHASLEPEDDWVMGGHTVYDAGARYETELKGVKTTFNFYVQNVTDKRYYTGTGGRIGAPINYTFFTSFEF